VIHVDDGLLFARSREIVNEFIRELKSKLSKITLYDDLKKYLGIEIKQDTESHRIALSQSSYVTEKIDRVIDEFESDYPLTTSEDSSVLPGTRRKRSVSANVDKRIPVSPKYNLRTSLKNESNASLLPITGVLRYLADRTRPDILVATGEISVGGSTMPSDDHIRAALQTLEYIQQSREKGLSFGHDPKGIELFGYCDASYISTGNCKSRLGGCLFLNRFSGAFLTFSKMDSTVSHSSTEAELKALDDLVRSVEVIRIVLDFMGHKQTNPTKIYIDNNSAIELVKTLKDGHKTRHINLRIQYLRQQLNSRQIMLVYVSTDKNVADCLTKFLYFDVYMKHISILLNGHNGMLPEDN
jgi:hypothetical protein